MNNYQNSSSASQSGPASILTIIGPTMRVEGAMTSREEVHLNGAWEGEIEVDCRLTIGAGAKTKGNIKAREVIVVGAANGNVESSERLVVCAGAHLEGNVKTAGIVIEDGAYFKGGIDIMRPLSSGR